MKHASSILLLLILLFTFPILLAAPSFTVSTHMIDENTLQLTLHASDLSEDVYEYDVLWGDTPPYNPSWPLRDTSLFVRGYKWTPDSVKILHDTPFSAQVTLIHVYPRAANTTVEVRVFSLDENFNRKFEIYRKSIPVTITRNISFAPTVGAKVSIPPIVLTPSSSGNPYSPLPLTTLLQGNVSIRIETIPPGENGGAYYTYSIYDSQNGRIYSTHSQFFLLNSDTSITRPFLILLPTKVFEREPFFSFSITNASGAAIGGEEGGTVRTITLPSDQVSITYAAGPDFPALLIRITEMSEPYVRYEIDWDAHGILPLKSEGYIIRGFDPTTFFSDRHGGVLAQTVYPRNGEYAIRIRLFSPYENTPFYEKTLFYTEKNMDTYSSLASPSSLEIRILNLSLRPFESSTPQEPLKNPFKDILEFIPTYRIEYKGEGMYIFDIQRDGKPFLTLRSYAFQSPGTGNAEVTESFLLPKEELKDGTYTFRIRAFAYENGQIREISNAHEAFTIRNGKLLFEEENEKTKYEQEPEEDNPSIKLEVAVEPKGYTADGNILVVLFVKDPSEKEILREITDVQLSLPTGESCQPFTKLPLRVKEKDALLYFTCPYSLFQRATAEVWVEIHGTLDDKQRTPFTNTYSLMLPSLVEGEFINPPTPCEKGTLRSEMPSSCIPLTRCTITNECANRTHLRFTFFFTNTQEERVEINDLFLLEHAPHDLPLRCIFSAVLLEESSSPLHKGFLFLPARGSGSVEIICKDTTGDTLPEQLTLTFGGRLTPPPKFPSEKTFTFPVKLTLQNLEENKRQQGNRESSQPSKDDSSSNTAQAPPSNPSPQPDHQNPSQEDCEGCKLNGKCVPISYRTTLENGTKVYCDVNGFNEQKEEGASCENDYECLSNQCVEGQCTNLLSEVKKNRGILEKILDFLKRLFVFP